MPVVPLNLNNFESSIISAGCPYVLTSPRSLRACKKAGIKVSDIVIYLQENIPDPKKKNFLTALRQNKLQKILFL